MFSDMFNCGVCGKFGSISWMGFIHMNFCEDCSNNRKKECDEAYKKVHDENVVIEARLPEVKYTEIVDVKTDYLQYIVQNKQEPELEMCLRRIAEQVYKLKITNYNCAKNWRWIPWVQDKDGKWVEGPKEFVDAALPFCYDRLKVYDAGRATAIDYFTAVCCGVYEQAKLKNWQDWAY